MSPRAHPEQPLAISQGAVTFAELIERTRGGCQEAAQTLYEQYSQHLLRVIRRRYLKAGYPMRRVVDSVDITQLAWAAAFDMVKKGKTFTDQQDFLGLLLRLTHRAFCNEYRHHITAAKRSLNCEARLSETEWDGVPAPHADHADDAAVKEEFRAIATRRVGSAVASLLERGATVAEIAEQLGISVRGAQVLVASARALLGA